IHAWMRRRESHDGITLETDHVPDGLVMPANETLGDTTQWTAMVAERRRIFRVDPEITPTRATPEEKSIVEHARGGTVDPEGIRQSLDFPSPVTPPMNLQTVQVAIEWTVEASAHHDRAFGKVDDCADAEVGIVEQTTFCRHIPELTEFRPETEATSLSRLHEFPHRGDPTVMPTLHDAELSPERLVAHDGQLFAR
ncbi:MAG: hypothetical protein UY72_C0047G0001, partial [Candidatus Uhrbacteria bacterium GW2011_GWD2_52_7]